jgi:hypothetical protein
VRKGAFFGARITNMMNLKKLNTPTKIQDYLNSIPFNFEKTGDELSGPLETIKKNRAHCF